MHGEALRKATGDDELAQHIEHDYTRADLDEDDRAMLAFASKLNDAPHTVSAADIQTLRDVEFSEDEIMDIVLITSLFNFNNRVMLGLGVETDTPRPQP